MIIATIDGGLLLVVYRQQNLGRSPSIILRIDRSMDFLFEVSESEMSVVSANDQTARDRSPVHGLRGFVCFRERRLVTCVVNPVSFQHCTAAAYAILNQFSVSY